MIFKSHFISMFIFSVVVSIILAFIKHDEKKDIVKYGVKLFLLMIGGVILVSWFMYLV